MKQPVLCLLCGARDAHDNPAWHVVELDGRQVHLCPRELPGKGQEVVEAFKKAYVAVFGRRLTT